MVLIIKVYYFVNYVQKFTQYFAVKTNSIYSENYWGSSVWISTQQILYFASVKYLEKMEIYWNSRLLIDFTKA